MEGIVKIRMTHFHVPSYDPYLDEEVVSERTVTYGQTVTTDDEPDEDADQNTLYGVPEREFKLRKSQGVFFSDEELQAQQQQAQPAEEGAEEQETFQQEITPVGMTTATIVDMAPWQLQEYVRNTDEETIVRDMNDHPDAADKVLEAEKVARRGEPRQAIADAVEALQAEPDSTAAASDESTPEEDEGGDDGEGSLPPVNPATATRDEMVEWYNANRPAGTPMLSRNVSKDVAREKVLQLNSGG